MSTITHPPVVPTLSPGLVPYRLNVDQYEAMIKAGVFTKHDRLELIEGLLVAKMTKGTKHSTASERCRRVIERSLLPGWHVRTEKPVRVPGRVSEPEPDVSVVRGDVDDYEGRNPDPDDVALVVEVGESSIVADQTEMVRVYGGGGIPVYWIVNLVDRQLEVYTSPTGGAYPAPTILGETQSVDLAIGGQVAGQIAVADLLPRRS
jgi:Uma2 family endonuclease